MKIMRRILPILTMLCAWVSTACAQSAISQPITMKESNKVLVAFFSRTGENYGVGHIDKGNTHIVAEMIARETGGRLFRIEPTKAYPDEYKACIEIAKTEKENNARLSLRGDIAVEDYDVIFLGYPNWWGDMPMAVYTFIEKHDWGGKRVIPFCTHEGSGLSDTKRFIEKACKGATVVEGVAIKGTTAQNAQPQAQKAIESWLKKIEMSGEGNK